MAAVAEAARNLSCVGAEPLAVTDNLNFSVSGNAQGLLAVGHGLPRIIPRLSGVRYPVTGGNVSLYNETKQDDGSLKPIHPTPVVGMVGLVDDITTVGGLGWRQSRRCRYLLGVPAKAMLMPARWVGRQQLSTGDHRPPDRQSARD